MLVLPGGNEGVKNLRSCKLLMNKVKEFAAKERKLLAAICAAPQLLGELDLLKDKEVAVYPNVDGYSGLVNSIIVNQEPYIMSSVNILTSPSMGAVFHFALKIVEILLGNEERKKIEREIIIFD